MIDNRFVAKRIKLTASYKTFSTLKATKEFLIYKDKEGFTAELFLAVKGKHLTFHRTNKALITDTKAQQIYHQQKYRLPSSCKYRGQGAVTNAKVNFNILTAFRNYFLTGCPDFEQTSCLYQ